MIFAETRRALLPGLFLLYGGLAIVAHAKSWDLAVIVKDKIDFYTRNKTFTGPISMEGNFKLNDMTYDDTAQMMYVSNTAGISSIFGVNLMNGNVTSILTNPNRSEDISGIAFDPLIRTLFWIDRHQMSIMKMYMPVNGRPTRPVVIQKLPESFLFNIVLDVCNRHIYWMNSNWKNPSIERCNYDGSNRMIIVNKNLYQPVSVEIDQAERKLYWIDDAEGISFKIERSNLDGSEREVLVHGRLQQPVHLAVDRDTIYWTDWVHVAVWSIPKYPKKNDNPTQFKSYRNIAIELGSIITRDNISKINCSAISMTKKRTNLSKPDPQPTSQTTLSMTTSFSNLIASTEESKGKRINISNSDPQTTTETYNDVITSTENSEKKINISALETQQTETLNSVTNSTEESEKSDKNNEYDNEHEDKEIYSKNAYCLHGGFLNETDGSCQCRPGFAGTFCEVSLCFNYCFHGKCSPNERGYPICSCTDPYTGIRCEKNICANYCLNNGKCIVKNKMPSCICTNSTGVRCERPNDTVEICAIYCANAELSNNNVTFCKCTNQTAQRIFKLSDQFDCTRMLATFISLFVVFLVITVGLSCYVIKLRKRPRIRRRFVVSKGGVTLTSRPGDGPYNPCEITIEDCCNMNVCETPCFEPNLPHSATPRSSSTKKDENSGGTKKNEKSSSKKKDDKNPLLDNIEGDMC